jgi:hypothetical protein
MNVLEAAELKDELRKLQSSHPRLFALVGKVIADSEPSSISGYECEQLRLYAIAERRFRETTNPVISAIGDEWGIAAEVKTGGSKAIEDALRSLRNAALSGRTEAYVPELIKKELRRLQVDGCGSKD